MSDSKNPTVQDVPDSPPRSPAGPESVASTSVALKERLLELIKNKQRKGTFKDSPIILFDQEEFEKIENTLKDLAASDDKPSISIEVLNDLRRQLDEVTMQRDRLQNASKKFTVQSAVLRKDLDEAELALRDERQKFATTSKAHENQRAELTSQLAQLRSNQDELNRALAKAKAANAVDDVAELSASKKNNADLITRINNELQAAKSALNAEKERKNKLETQVLDLSNQLNAEKAKLNVAQGKARDPPGDKSFSETVIATGKANVDLINKAYLHLTKQAKDLLKGEGC